MTLEKIKEWSNKCHSLAVEKGFWNDPDPDRALLLILSELMEGFEAYRKDKRWNNVDIEKMNIDDFQDYRDLFEHYQKDTFEDELADVFIRTVDLIGYYNVFNEKVYEQYKKQMVEKKTGLAPLTDDNMVNFNFIFIREVLAMRTISTKTLITIRLINLLDYLTHVSKHLDINLELAIQQKHEYNKTREYLHGKKF